MKEQYKALLDLDIDQIDPMPLSDDQKMTIKTYVFTNNLNRKQKFNMRHLTTAALVAISVVSGSYFALPAIAEQIPFLQNVLLYFEDEELPATYADLSTEVNQVQASNGIDVMIQDAVYDGTSVIITYALQTGLELGNDPSSEGWLDIKNASGTSGTGSIEKINDTTYVGVEKITPFFENENPDEIHVEWMPQAFINHQTGTKIEGNWQFEFNLSSLPTNFMQLDESIKQDGIQLTMKSLDRSKMAAVLQYEFDVEEAILHDWPFVSIEISEVKDNLGNSYSVEGNGGVSYDNGTSNEWKATIYSLDERASSLIITPEIYYSKGSGESLKKTRMNPITIELN